MAKYTRHGQARNVGSEGAITTPMCALKRGALATCKNVQMLRKAGAILPMSVPVAGRVQPNGFAAVSLPVALQTLRMMPEMHLNNAAVIVGPDVPGRTQLTRYGPRLRKAFLHTAIMSLPVRQLDRAATMSRRACVQKMLQQSGKPDRSSWSATLVATRAL